MTPNWAAQGDVVGAALMEQYPTGPGTPRLTLLHLAENATFAVSYGSEPQPRSVARVYRAGRHSPVRIDSELAWVEALADTGIRTARPNRTLEGGLTGRLELADGSETRFAVLDFLASDPAAPQLDETITALGVLSGALQTHARSWEPPRDFDRPTWDAESTLTEATSWGRWMSSDLPPESSRILTAARLRILAELPAVSGPNRVLQHADLKAANTIWAGGELHVIDFDDSGYSWPLFDLAASLTGLENLPETPQLVDAWLDGYTSKSSVTDGVLATIPALLMQRRLMILGWLLAHPEGHRAVNRSDAIADTTEMGRRFLDDALFIPSHL